MRRSRQGSSFGSSLALLSLLIGLAHADEDPCAGFGWNVSHERALFASTPAAVGGGHESSASPLLEPDRLYEVSTVAVDAMHFAAAPASKHPPSSGSFAALARLQLAHAGDYRISADQPVWIDVVADGHVLASSDFQGRGGCHAPHKIVLFSLPANAMLVLQLSGATSTPIRIAITEPVATPGLAPH